MSLGRDQKPSQEVAEERNCMSQTQKRKRDCQLTVGCGVGASVGARVGSVGAAVGSLVGRFVVGCLVGRLVVGCLVGDGVAPV